jgi:hypothetical protein
MGQHIADPGSRRLMMTTTTSSSVPSLTLVRAERQRRRALRKAKRVTAKQRRTVGQAMASVGASLMPVASFSLAHTAGTNPTMWCLVVAALAYSLPSVASWARTWTGNNVKAYGFAVLLEGVLVFAPGGDAVARAVLPYLAPCCLTALILINAVAAWAKAKGK